MTIELKNNCSEFDSYRAARVKSMFNAETGANWQKTVNLFTHYLMGNNLELA